MFKKLIKKQYKILSGFSVAEAFVVLGLGAMVTATVVPVISKQVQYNNLSESQSTVMQLKINESNKKVKDIKVLVNEKVKKEIKILKEKEPEVPIGAVMFFDLTACPEGWELLSNKYPAAVNAFFSNLSGSGRLLGSVEASVAPNVKGTFHAMDLRGVYSGPFYHAGGTTVYGYGRQGAYYYRQQGMNLSRTSSVYQDNVNEVRPQNIALLACRKVAK